MHFTIHIYHWKNNELVLSETFDCKNKMFDTVTLLRGKKYQGWKLESVSFYYNFAHVYLREVTI